MSRPKFELAIILDLLRRSENDPEDRNSFGQAISRMERDERHESLEFKSEGIDVVFKETWVRSSDAVADPRELYVAAFHLHREGHEGYVGYSGQLPNSVTLDEPESDVLRKMGHPILVGGGGLSKVLEGPISRWFRYALGKGFLNLQLDANGRLEMATVDSLYMENDLLSPTSL